MLACRSKTYEGDSFGDGGVELRQSDVLFVGRNFPDHDTEYRIYHNEQHCNDYSREILSYALAPFRNQPQLGVLEPKDRKE